MAKVAIIGAGSVVFCKTLILDILATKGLEDTEFALMAQHTTHPAGGGICQQGDRGQ